jgi:hypothetical protein
MRNAGAQDDQVPAPGWHLSDTSTGASECHWDGRTAFVEASAESTCWATAIMDLSFLVFHFYISSSDRLLI